MSDIYGAAGVSLENGYKSIDLIKKDVESTKIPGVMSSLGGFASMFDLSEVDVLNPVLVSGCDGVGTKVLLAQAANDFRYIGHDLVAMSVNDIIVTGAKPLYFLDYIACGKNEPEVIAQIVGSVSEACKLSSCALVGGETAEMPDCYKPGSYDLAGFVVGVVDKTKMIDVTNVAVGDAIVGVKSNGLHANGFSLVRKLLFKDNDYKLDDIVGDIKLIDELLKPTKIYVDEVKYAMENFEVKSMSHITGGGFDENIPRSINGLGAKINLDNIQKQPIFELLQKLANISYEEMFNFFNMGIGMTFVIPETDRARFLSEVEGSVDLGVIVQKVGVHFENSSIS